MYGMPEVLPSSGAASCDPEIAEAFNTFCAMLKVNDALIATSKAINHRRRRASSRSLIDAHIAPLFREVGQFQPASGYAREAAHMLLVEARSLLEQPRPSQHGLKYKNDLQLVDEHLQPVFSKLCNPLGAHDERANLEGLIAKLSSRTLREWFRRDQGAELECLLEHLAMNEYRSPLVVTHDPRMAEVPGYCLEISREEADEWGLVEDDALSDEDAEQASIVSYSSVSIKNRELGWHQPSSGTGMLLYAVALVRERLESRRSGKPQKKHPSGYFCELCSELTQWASNSSDSSKAQTGSNRFCKEHADKKIRARYMKDRSKKYDIGRLSRLILAEANKDPTYMERLLGTSEGGELTDVVEHMKACSFCQGEFGATACFDPSKKFFAKLMAIHANARKVAYKLADSYHGYKAAGIDINIQRGLILMEVSSGFGLMSSIAVSQHSGIALAHLIHQRLKGVEIAQRLGMSERWVSENRSRLTGCFDFCPSRNLELRWWPFDDLPQGDISGPYVMRFPTRSLGSSKRWRHSAEEYRFLTHSSTRG